MFVDRIFEAVLLVMAAKVGLALVSRRAAASEVSVVGLLRSHRPPVAAIAVTAALVVGALLQVCWPGALDALRTSPASGQWWRVLTAPFVQDSGIVGALFNIVTAAIVVALAEWQWGRLLASGLWLVGAWAPVGAVASLVGYHVAAQNVVAYSAGSSGATYFTAGTLCAAAILGLGGRERLAGLAGLGVALLMWLWLDDGHGVVLTVGVALGLLLWCAVRILRIPTPNHDADPQVEGSLTYRSDNRPGSSCEMRSPRSCNSETASRMEIAESGSSAARSYT